MSQLSKVLLENRQLYLHIHDDVIELKPLSTTLFRVLDVPVTTTIEFRDDAAIVKQLNFCFTLCQKLETLKKFHNSGSLFWASIFSNHS